MILAVLDTNVLASGFVGLNKSDSLPGAVRRRWRNNVFMLVSSEPILSELARAFQNPYFTRIFSASEVEAVFAGLRTEAIIQPITAHVAGIAAHPQDDVILATALSAGANYLVTGVRELLERISYRGLQLVTPRQFLHVLS